MRWREVNQKRKEYAPYRDKVYLIKPLEQYLGVY